MRAVGNIFDFHHFLDVCQKAGKTHKIYPLGCNSFYPLESHASQSKLKKEGCPKLKKIGVAQFVQGSKKIYYSNVIDDENLKEFDFLQKKTKMAMPQPVEAPRGLNTDKKTKICNNLVPLMPAQYRAFWNELPNSDSSKDLMDT